MRLSVIEMAFLGFALFFIVKAILATSWRSSGTRRGRLDAFSKDAGRLDCMILAVLMLIGFFVSIR